MTIREVAERAGVSVATVSAVINENKYVSDELRSRVLQAIRDLDYRPNRWAKSLATGKGYTIAYVVPDITNPIFSQITKGIQEVANGQNYSVILCSTNFDSPTLQRYVDWILEMRVDGVVFTGSHHQQSLDEMIRIVKAGIPLAAAMAPGSAEFVDRILINDQEAACQAVTILQNQGCHAVAFLGVSESTTSLKRLRGYQEAVTVYSPELTAFGADFTWQDGYTAMQAILSRGCLFDGVFAGSDLMALGAAAALREHSRRIPGDIQLMGFDNTYAHLADSPFQSMAIPAFDIGKTAADVVFWRMNDRQRPPTTTTLQARLVGPAAASRKGEFQQQ